MHGSPSKFFRWIWARKAFGSYTNKGWPYSTELGRSLILWLPQYTSTILVCFQWKCNYEIKTASKIFLLLFICLFRAFLCLYIYIYIHIYIYIYMYIYIYIQPWCFEAFSHGRKSLQWRHNGLDGVSNHQPHDCLLNRLFRRRSKKTAKPRVTGLCEGNSPVPGEFPAQRASNAENVSIWWRHHVW